MVWTNLGKQKMFEEFFASGAIGDTFRLCLASSGGAGDWTVDTSSTADLTAVSSLDKATGTEGGTSGLIIVRDGTSDATNFDVSSADDLGLASAVRAVLQTAGDDFQYSGAFDNARYVVLVDAGAEGSAFDFTTATNNVYAWWDIGSNQNVSKGNTLTITNLSLQGQ
jgi:hypothetical protein